MNTKKPIILSVIALFVLISLVVGATFAYFQAQGGVGKSADITVKTYTTDTFTFATGNPISFTLDQDNFASGKGNVTGSTFASAILTANNKTNTATEHYYVYLNIENNTFTYSINESTPEIIMTVTNSSGTEITDIPGLTHTSVTDGKGTTISGYDITNKSGLITLFNNREIMATPTKEEKWNIKVTFVNYNANQNANSGNSMSAKVMIQKEEEKVFLADYVKSLYTGTQGENNIYYHNGTITTDEGTVIDAGDNSYRYAGANPNNYVCFGSDVTPCPTENLYRIIGVIGNQVKLIKYDYANSNLLGTDGDYSTTKYSKSSSSYYKGSLTTINRYYWNNSTSKNTWSESELNKTNLNVNYIAYLNNIDTKWAKKIAETTWKVGGNTFANISQVVPTVAYQNEITNPVTTNTTDGAKEYSAKIGLMYVSDYGFAAEPSAWTLTMDSYDNTTAKSTNWMYMGLYEWTISRRADRSNIAFDVLRGGLLGGSDMLSDASGVRPSFNLMPSITYVSGSGSASDPMVIN